MLLQHSSKLLNRENDETVSWRQTYSSNLSFSWSDSLAVYERFTNPTPHSFVTLSSTTKLGLGLPNKVMSTCELSKLGRDETKKEQWARVFLRGFNFSSSFVRVLWVRLKRNKPGNRDIVSSMGCFIAQLSSSILSTEAVAVRIFPNKNASKLEEREHCLSRVHSRNFSCCLYCVKKMTSQSNCLVFLVTRPQEHSVVMVDEN